MDTGFREIDSHRPFVVHPELRGLTSDEIEAIADGTVPGDSRIYIARVCVSDMAREGFARWTEHEEERGRIAPAINDPGWHRALEPHEIAVRFEVDSAAVAFLRKRDEDAERESRERAADRRAQNWRGNATVALALASFCIAAGALVVSLTRDTPPASPTRTEVVTVPAPVAP
jgi:hypothetical protein